MPRHVIAALLLVCAAAGLSQAQEEGATFRFDEIEPRRFDYNDEYFINVLNYRKRITHRWEFLDAALGYDVTAGSLRSNELYLNHRARVRLPFSDVISAEYRFYGWEDFDARFQRHEVELLFRFFRPSMRLPLLATVGRTPAADGLFFGGQGVLEADKELADLGLIAGYRNALWGLRLDALAPDFFFNDKNSEGGEFKSKPYTLRAKGWLDLLDGDLALELWSNVEVPLTLDLPQRNGGLVFRYRQLRGGINARWRARHDLRFDLEARAERTRKRRHAPNDADLNTSDRLNREALRVNVQAEWDVAPLWGSCASRSSDTWVFSLQFQTLNEIRRRPRNPLMRDTLRRHETYAEVSYVLAIPSPGPNYRFGIRASALAGFLSWRDVKPLESRHRVTEKFLAKVAGGFEIGFRQDRASAFFQMTYRVDDQTFGGGNVQVQMSF